MDEISEFENTFFNIEKTPMETDPITAYYKGEIQTFDKNESPNYNKKNSTGAKSESIGTLIYFNIIL